MRPIRMLHDVRYSSVHPRNLLDIYYKEEYCDRGSSLRIKSNSNLLLFPNRRSVNQEENTYLSLPLQCDSPTVLFIHGGMWLRGDKNRESLPASDFISNVLGGTETYNEGVNSYSRSPTTTKSFQSNVGITLAKAGGTVCVMNYRLANTEQVLPGEVNTGKHPNQVMDVARCIAFVIEGIISDYGPHSTTASKQFESKKSKLYIGGHSAGAHLGALALSDTRWLEAAFHERGIGLRTGQSHLGGFFGLSGVYNLPRLAMNPAAAITVGPAFGVGDHDIIYEASPIHALLTAEKNISSMRKLAQNQDETMQNPDSKLDLPPLASIPVALLNAEDGDFHLTQDSEQLLVALRRFDLYRETCEGYLPFKSTEVVDRNHYLIPSRNHLSIERLFGSGIDKLLHGKEEETFHGKEVPILSRNVRFSDKSEYYEPAFHSMTGSFVKGLENIVDKVFPSLYKWTRPDTSVWQEEVDETSIHVLRLLGLMKSSGMNRACTTSISIKKERMR